MRDAKFCIHYIKEAVPELTKEAPSRVTKNKVLFIDARFQSLDDIKKDGNGKYNNKGRFAWTYRPNGEVSQDRLTDHKKLGSHSFMLVKTYFQHKQYKDFRRELIYISDKQNEFVNNVIIVVYYFTGKEHDIVPEPHANSKTKHGYTAVKKSVIAQVSLNAKQTSTREAIEQHIQSQGGRAKILMENLPTPDQVQRALGKDKVRKQSSPALLADVLEWCTNNKSICLAVHIHPEPIIILATEQHLIDIERFACHTKGEPLTVDPTFNLGDFFVTPITYRNTLIKSKKTGNPASFCGPMMIHFKKTFAVYDQFFSELKKKCPNLSNLCSFGTDGEAALINALLKSFPKAKQLRCYKHFEDNLVSKSSAFGHVGTVKAALKSLCTCSTEEFDDLFERTVEQFSTKSEALVKFLEFNRETIVDNVHCSNNNGKLFYNNASESVNEKIKEFLKYRSVQLYCFLDAMQEFFQCEKGSAEHCYIGLSTSYTMADGIDSTLGNIMAATEAEKLQVIQKFNTIKLPIINVESPEAEQSGTQIVNTIDFSVSPENCQLSISLSILNSMFKKAAALIVTTGILPAPKTPGCDYTYSSLSDSSSRHHIIKVQPNGNILCDCNGYKSHKICSHSISAGHLSNRLYDFICFHRRTNRGTSSHAITQHIDVSRAGKKANDKGKRDRSRGSSQTQMLATCSVAHDNVIKYVLMNHHANVQRCYHCKKKNMKDYETGLAQKIFREYIPKGQKASPANMKVTMKKEWAYFHIHCAHRCFVDKTIHVCPGVTVLKSDQEYFTDKGFKLSSD